MTMPSGRKQLLLWIAAALAATAALATILLFERRSGPAHALYIVGDPQRGSALFFGEKQCHICHSVNGAGGRIAPDLSATHPRPPAMGWLATAMWNHAPGMFRRIRGRQSYPQLDVREMADILAFLYRAANSDQPGDVAAGEQVFRQKGCVECHAVRSVGGRSAPELSVVAGAGAGAWISAMWNHSHSMIGPVTKTLGEWPQFSGNDMNNLLAFVSEGKPANTSAESSGNAERGWSVFQKQCIQCHSVRGNGGKVGPELGPEHDLPLSTTQFASVLWNHAPAMLHRSTESGAPTLDKTDVADLVAFVASLRYFEPTGSPFVGERVFNSRGCAQCHGAAAEGTQLGPGIRARAEAYSAVSLTTALWKHGPKMVDRAAELGIAWPTLEADDLGELVSFLNSTAAR